MWIKGFDYIASEHFLPSHCGFFFMSLAVDLFGTFQSFLSMLVQQLVVILVCSWEEVSSRSFYSPILLLNPKDLMWINGVDKENKFQLPWQSPLIGSSFLGYSVQKDSDCLGSRHCHCTLLLLHYIPMTESPGYGIKVFWPRLTTVWPLACYLTSLSLCSLTCKMRRIILPTLKTCCKECIR